MKISKKVFCASVVDNPYIKQEPTTKQSQFLVRTEKEAMFGGAAGGGKSSSLLISALMYVQEPKYSALILRRTYADLSLPGAIMDRANEWLRNTDAKWKEQTKTWTFPSGATLSFGYLEHENDKFRYQGAEFQFIAFDELSQFTESQYLYLFSRMRRLENSTVPLRLRAATNPGGVGGEWVNARFIKPEKTEMINNDRIFIPASLEDNPYIDRVGYEEALDKLDPVTKAQLRYGNWDIQPDGNLFKREWFKVCELFEIPKVTMRKVRFWDLAASAPSDTYKDPDYTAGVLVGLADKRFYILDVVRIRKDPLERDNIIKAVVKQDGAEVLQRVEQEPGSGGVAQIVGLAQNVFQGYNMQGVKSTGSKEVRAAGFSGAVSNGLVYLIRAPWNSQFISECCAFPQKGIHDDVIDAAASAYNQLIGFNTAPVYSTNFGFGLSSSGLRV